MSAFKIVLAASAAALLMGGAALAQGAKPSPVIAAAVSDPLRPTDDKALDAERLPAEVLAASGVKPGQTVVELGASGGYYTRMLSKVLGPKGKLLVDVNGLAARPAAADGIKAFAAQYPTITIVGDDYLTFAALPEKADMVWTTDNYHDFHNAMDTAAFDKAVFSALKPGGYFFVEDHAAAAGAGMSVTKTMHRIEPAALKAEVLAAGFKLVRESSVLANKADDHSKVIFDPAIRRHTDRFIMVFQKP